MTTGALQGLQITLKQETYLAISRDNVEIILLCS
jgi:hypothetical protein